MATTFPITTYPILQSEDEQTLFSGVLRDKSDDGTPYVRSISTSQWREIPLNFSPLTEANSKTLVQYLFDNAATLFDLAMQGYTITGYLWSEPTLRKVDGQWWVSILFYGRKTA